MIQFNMSWEFEFPLSRSETRGAAHTFNFVANNLPPLHL